jgi:zeaxanthin glucosyltransferase
MAHIGITSPPAQSHLSNMLLLGRELRKRGHRVTMFNIQEIEGKAVGQDLEFAAIGQSAFPPGTAAALEAQAGRLSGLTALQFTLKHIGTFARVICEELPPLARERRIDALLVDQDEAAGGSVAEHLGIAFVTVSNGLAFNAEPGVPPVYMPWIYRNQTWAQLRNRFCYWTAAQITRSIRNVINQHRMRWSLPASEGLNDSLSSYAQLSQQPPAFDFPRRQLPPTFHYIGPFRGPALQPVPFPWDRLDGRPIVYASLGTLLSARADLFHKIVEALRPLEAQLVISHVGCLSKAEANELAKGALVVRYAPQFDLLARAQLTITHGGLNTVLDSLSHGVPVLAMPVMNDAFGTGARLTWTGSGKVISPNHLHVSSLRSAITDLLSNECYRHAALKIRRSIQEAGGLAKAIDIIDEVVRTRRPVLRA